MTENIQPIKQLLLKNATYYTSDGFKQGNILSYNGKITAINAEMTDLANPDQPITVYDVQGKYVLPGAIDTHVHVREPGWPEREDFFSGTAAALAGGITTICQMPNTQPTPHDLPSLEQTRQAARPKILCDMAVYAAAGYDNREQLAVLAQEGICGFKTFLQFGSKPQAPQYITVQNRQELEALLAASAQTGLRHFFHCEDYDLIGRLEKAAHQCGAESYAFHYQTRPDAAELKAVQQVLHAARKTGARVGIAHVSTVAAAEAIRQAKASGLDVTCEVCFHHLFFDDSWLDRFGPWAKCNPPLRSAANVTGLWPYLLDGTVDYIGSDHAPHLTSAKEQGKEQIWLAPSGIAHIELLLPMLLNAVNENKITLERLTELCCVNGYKQMRLYPQKGRIAVGADADFTIVDLEKKWQFAASKMQTKARENAHLFDGLQLHGAVEAAIVRGQLQYAAGKVDYQTAGYGRILSCQKPEPQSIENN